MKCAICGKPAVHHIMRIAQTADKSLTVIHLCQEHYQQYGQIGAELPETDDEGLPVPVGESAEPVDLEATCGNCGETYRHFRESSKFGCAECYAYFGDRLVPLFERLQQGLQHEGKAPLGGATRAKLREEVQQLRREKEEAVQREDFEAAARLRDRIRQLQGSDEE